MIGDFLKLRFADHENTSAQHEEPDFNFVNRTPTEHELEEIVTRVQYPRLCKKTAFAKHVGLTVPRLKKLLNPACVEKVFENETHPSASAEYVVVAAALEQLVAVGITERIPVQQEIYSRETFRGF